MGKKRCDISRNALIVPPAQIIEIETLEIIKSIAPIPLPKRNAANWQRNGGKGMRPIGLLAVRSQRVVVISVSKLRSLSTANISGGCRQFSTGYGLRFPLYAEAAEYSIEAAEDSVDSAVQRQRSTLFGAGLPTPPSIRPKVSQFRKRCRTEFSIGTSPLGSMTAVNGWIQT